MSVTIRLDGFPLYAFVSEWMVFCTFVGACVLYFILRNYGSVRYTNG